MKFDPKEWSGISDDAKDLIKKMLERDPAERISAVSAMAHPFFSKKHSETFDKETILKRIKDFRAPLQLQQ